jgi:RNA 2',3'-cyclic 3'-phosphodiesterase
MSGGTPPAAARERTRRVFFAFWPDETLRAELVHATHKATRACGGRPVPAHNLHTTLLFLGSVAEARIPDLVAIGARVRAAGSVAGAVEAAPTPALVFDRIEFWERARVLVATISAMAMSATGTRAGNADAPSSGLAIATALAASLLRETHAAGFAPDLKPFRPHVTLARKVARVGRPLQMHEVRWPLAGFALVESVTLAAGPLYGVLNSWELTTG